MTSHFSEKMDEVITLEDLNQLKKTSKIGMKL